MSPGSINLTTLTNLLLLVSVYSSRRATNGGWRRVGRWRSLLNYVLHVPYVLSRLRVLRALRAIVPSESLKKYKKQKNYCSRLYKKEPKKFFSNLDSSKICDNKAFWKTIQPFFSEKRKITNKITLVDEDETVISDDQLISEELISFLKNFTKALNIQENSYLVDKTELSDPVQGRS